jgi:hypothetical protein
VPRSDRRTRHKLGARLREGAHLRFVPPIEMPWISTFNLRWWQHVDNDETAKSTKRATRTNGVGRPT